MHGSYSDDGMEASDDGMEASDDGMEASDDGMKAILRRYESYSKIIGTHACMEAVIVRWHA